ncbi:uncharacterized protein LOC116645406 [Phoca vitulina]|uniref:uncharacterized protein LOC116645406 n=1 Tax=Phoca vitulina TaxID=9720 RepID=UPI001395F357|nr:uncharacterized protein LOC116645406 [Phoca vitulina]
MNSHPHAPGPPEGQENRAALSKLYLRLRRYIHAFLSTSFQNRAPNFSAESRFRLASLPATRPTLPGSSSRNRKRSYVRSPEFPSSAGGTSSNRAANGRYSVGGTAVVPTSEDEAHLLNNRNLSTGTWQTLANSDQYKRSRRETPRLPRSQNLPLSGAVWSPPTGSEAGGTATSKACVNGLGAVPPDR